MHNLNLFGADVWAVGGGKGGTGKSFLASSMGLCMASSGRKVVLLDADLGGANIHSFLGIKRPKRSLTDFFDRKVPLEDLVVDSGVEGLSLVIGDLGSLSPDIKYTQKLKLLRHIKKLKADNVIIDLGGGSHQNTLDLFLFADRMIIIVVPELPSIENMYHFIKNAFFRKMGATLAEHDMKDKFFDIWKNRDAHGIINMVDLVRHMKELWPGLTNVFDAVIEDFQLDLVVNQIRSSSEMSIGASVKSVFKNYLGFEARYAGYVEYEDSVRQCTGRGKPFVLTYPTSHCTGQIKRLEENLMRKMQVQVVNV
jgi:flagellar biosynthesis protein FlhG